MAVQPHVYASQAIDPTRLQLGHGIALNLVQDKLNKRNLLSHPTTLAASSTTAA